MASANSRGETLLSSSPSNVISGTSYKGFPGNEQDEDDKDHFHQANVSIGSESNRTSRSLTSPVLSQHQLHHDPHVLHDLPSQHDFTYNSHIYSIGQASPQSPGFSRRSETGSHSSESSLSFTRDTPKRYSKPSLDRRRLSINTLLTNNERLESALELEEMECHKLEKTLQDHKIKLSNSLLLQSQLEDDLVKRDEQIGLLQKQAKDARKTRIELETELSEEVKKYINEKQMWLSKEEEYEEKLSNCNTKIKSLSENLEVARLEFENLKFSGGSSRSAAPSVKNVEASQPISDSGANKFIERMKKESEMAQQQMEMVTREYQARYNRIKSEMEQVQEVNKRLIEENEGFQLLLAEKTILGGFSLADELDQDVNQDVFISEDDETENQQKLSDTEASSSFESDSDLETPVSKRRPVRNSSLPNYAKDEAVTNAEGVDDIDPLDTDDDNIRSLDIPSDSSPTSDSKKSESKTPPSLSTNAKRQVYQLQFEKTSLQNYNRALKSSLERLVSRLLEYREFEKVVEDHNVLNKRSITSFQDRVVSLSNQHPPTLDVPRQRLNSASAPASTASNQRGHSFTSSISSGFSSVMGRSKGANSISGPSGNIQGHHSHSSSNPLFHMNPPTTPSGIVPRPYRGTLRPSSTWSSMLFAASPSTPTSPNINRDSRQFSTTSTNSESTAPRSPSSTSSLVSSSSAASISSGCSGTLSVIDPTILPLSDNKHLVRTTTRSQKQLRPLRLVVAPTDANSNPAPPLQSASSQSSGWFS
ncbi:hypothetical protein AWJ20_4953 [Sugiyamaella lignohabitans]|uniref:Uncharacterized protein n=1 Tax=Sugiyamaella lignohabitans TaxID=796027 RepID=A0A167EF60_9ASCO|nr:uncharacterized protein AWJ20_4953 [Sugiyamaella lignohabitans]ANB13999.1 hypothetical protein AWJ20_4953 [Sugiyamaella lignohabitans]